MIWGAVRGCWHRGHLTFVERLFGLTTLIDVLVVFLFIKPMVTLLAGTRLFGGGHRWSGLDPARLGAKTPWRSSAR